MTLPSAPPLTPPAQRRRRRRHSSSPTPSNVSSSSRLSQEEIEQILTSPQETGYTYSNSAAYKRSAQSTSFQHPQLCRSQRTPADSSASPSSSRVPSSDYYGHENFRSSGFSQPGRANIADEFIGYVVARAVQFVVVFVVTRVSYALRYSIWWLIEYFVLKPLLAPYYIARRYYRKASNIYNALTYLFPRMRACLVALWYRYIETETITTIDHATTLIREDETEEVPAEEMSRSSTTQSQIQTRSQARKSHQNLSSTPAHLTHTHFQEATVITEGPPQTRVNFAQIVVDILSLFWPPIAWIWAILAFFYRWTFGLIPGFGSGIASGSSWIFRQIFDLSRLIIVSMARFVYRATCCTFRIIDGAFSPILAPFYVIGLAVWKVISMIGSLLGFGIYTVAPSLYHNLAWIYSGGIPKSIYLFLTSSEQTAGIRSSLERSTAGQFVSAHSEQARDFVAREDTKNAFKCMDSSRSRIEEPSLYWNYLGRSHLSMIAYRIL
ncbi:hypothetical protein DdX_16955 [Ditylenchus destructor]|uniref:Uncharacterized protein n=1 Tax=Ditylenchus destructor TaxID=166010 RepID=A0AAD4MMJ5_9BILA|nr:hypothetical protein DdX_16955 [Ditylenchus destructor]